MRGEQQATSSGHGAGGGGGYDRPGALHTLRISGAGWGGRSVLSHGVRLLALALGLILLQGRLATPSSLAQTTTASSQTFSYTGGLQTFTVPAGVTAIRIKAVGASGGSEQIFGGHAGLGASMEGDFPVTPGQQLTVLAGGAGTTGYYSGAGGGGSFVWSGSGFAALAANPSVNLLIAAGGGGGATCPETGTSPNGQDASTSADGTTSPNTGAGGTNGSGGTGGVAPGDIGYGEGGGGGGGGLTGDGTSEPNGAGSFGGGGGQAIIHGGAGGTALDGSQINGGFGGGGGSGSGGAVNGGGGGGGYSGGGGGNVASSGGCGGGGGGGSYNGGTNQSNTAGAGTGGGQVVISWGPPAVTSPTATSVTDTAATLGGTVTDDGAVSVSERGVVYAPTATNSNPQIGGAGVTKAAAAAGGTGTFTVIARGLRPVTGYSYAAYAITSVGVTGYSSVASFTTTKTPTTTSLASSLNPSVYGQSVTFTATVTAGATGTVQFSVDGTNAGAAVPLSNGAATYQAASLSGGSHAISAVYSGDTSFATSTVALSGGQQVNQAPTTLTLISSVNPAGYGQTVTFTATVTVNQPVPGQSAPTGSVRFNEGSRCATGFPSLGSPTLSSSSPYQVSIQPDLCVGTNYIFADYPGDANFALSTAEVAQVVQAPPTLTSPTAASVTDTTATLGGTVSDDGGATVTERGVVYAPTATNSNPQINGTGVTTVAATAGGAGVFTVNVSGLTPGTGYSHAAYATNGAGTGYSSVATFTTPAPPDRIPPVVTVSFPAPNQSGWFTSSPVSGTVTADDATTGDSNITTITCTGTTVGTITGLGTPRASAPLSVATEGTTSVSCTATDSASNSGAASGSSNTATVKLDTTLPTLKPTLSPSYTCPAPLTGICVAQGASVAASPNATDATSGVNTQKTSCGTIDTSKAGSSSVICTAADNAGNAATATLSYTVIQIITGTTSSSLTVAAGQTVLVSGGTIGGSVAVQTGGALALQNATIKGSLAAKGAGALTICGSTVQGAMSVSGSSGFVRIGDYNNDESPGCGGNTLTSLSLSGNTGGYELGGNQISGSVSVAGNSGGGPSAEDATPEIEGNTIKDDLNCKDNTPAPVNDGHPNTVGGKRGGQCATL